MQIVSELIEKGADPNSTPFGEDSALILAVEYVLPTVVQILLESGADINHVGQNGQNVLHSCFRRKGVIMHLNFCYFSFFYILFYYKEILLIRINTSA